jgi:2-polyprenyl-3-methyl-5-hydroxy-6-metoxy-1,4-benzoquinol methylase
MKMLLNHEDTGRRVRVMERLHDSSRLYYDSGALYTHVDAGGRNLLEYINGMDVAMGAAPDVLLLGTAGGALATQLARRDVEVTAVDDWAQAFNIAREWFHLPAAVRCVHADAMTFLRDTTGRFSAIAVDVFHGLEIPEAVLTTEIGPLLLRALKPGGVIVWNVADHSKSATVRWILQALTREGLKSSLVSVYDDDVGNTLVVGRHLQDASARLDALAA